MARLDRETVVDAAFALADDQGLEALTLRRVAARLGVTPMALYRHVDSKEALLDEVTERLYELLALPDVGTEWWDALAEIARSARSVLLAHPWAAPLFARPLAGPHARALDEALQGALRGAGFSTADVRELHDQLSNMLFALVAPELNGRRNRAAFERGLQLIHA